MLIWVTYMLLYLISTYILFQSGILRYCGPTEFAPGIWTGIELDDSVGKNDGSVMGVQYFTCLPKHGKINDVNMNEIDGFRV